MRTGRIRTLSDLSVGSSSINASSVNESVSTDKGFLTPRMTTGQRDAIPTPATGLLIYNTSTSLFNFYDGTVWRSISIGDFWIIRDADSNTFVRVATSAVDNSNQILAQIGDATGYTPNQTVLQIDNTGTTINSLSALSGSNSNGLPITIQSGSGDDAGSTDGGSIIVITGTGTDSGFSAGQIILSTGNANNLANAGDITLSPGAGEAGVGGGRPGDTNILAGESNGYTSGAGNVLIRAGLGTANETPGNTTISGGWTSLSSTSTGGLLRLSGGDSDSSASTAGDVIIRGGQGQDGSNHPSNGGNVFIGGGQGSADPGQVIIGSTGNDIFTLAFKSNTGNQVGFVAPGGLAISQIWTLPSIAGSTGQALVRGAGSLLTWSDTVGTFTQTFTNASLSSGLLTVTHNLSATPVIVQVYDNTNSMIIPDQITLTSTNVATVNLTSFGALAGTWVVIVKK